MSGHSYGELGGEDPYAILGLMPGAGDDEIRAARRRLLRRFHPDLPGGDLRRTQMITAAAYILLDPVRRSAYRDGVSTTSVVGRDVRVEYRTEPAADPAPPFRPRRPAASQSGGTGSGGTGPGGTGPGGTGSGGTGSGGTGSGGGAARPDVRVVWQEAAQAPPTQRGWFDPSPGNGFASASPPGPSTPDPSAPDLSAPDLSAAPASEPEPALWAAGEPRPAPDPVSGGAAAPGPGSPSRGSPPPGSPPPWGPPRWSALAIIAALCTLTCTPLSLFVGLAALVQIRRTGRRGKALALFGTAVGGLFLVLYVLLVPSTVA